MDDRLVDYYNLLNVSHDATFDEIRAAYRRLAKQYHPDTAPKPFAEQITRMMQSINDAYETLSDPDKRSAYDARRAAAAFGSNVQTARPSAASRNDTPPINLRRGKDPTPKEGPERTAHRAVVNEPPPQPVVLKTTTAKEERTTEMSGVVGLIILATTLYRMRDSIGAAYHWVVAMLSGG